MPEEVFSINKAVSKKKKKIDLPNTNPNVNATQRDHIPPLALGLAFCVTLPALCQTRGSNTDFGTCVGSARVLDTNLLVSVTQNARVTNTRPQGEWFCILVEYRRAWERWCQSNCSSTGELNPGRQITSLTLYYPSASRH